MKPKGEVRRSQLITTYGVGAIIAVEDESFMVAGIDRWAVKTANIHEPRLERQLNVQGFVLPPAGGPSALDVPVVRFPLWYSCPACNKLEKHSFFCSFEKNRCPACDVPLVPSRFVVCCGKGHIDDFPYYRWLHAGSTRISGQHPMTIEARGASASLRDIRLTCGCGVNPVTMEGAFGKNAMKGIITCNGNRPWLSGPPEPCNEIPRTLQRGASNVWFPVVLSSLSIPPWSEGAFKVLNRYWSILRHIPEDALAQTIRGMNLTSDTSYTVDELVLAVRQRKDNETGGLSAIDDAALKAQEYEALIKGKFEVSRDQDFVCEAAEKMGPTTSQWFEKVMLVKRLREVRALQSFTRILPSNPGEIGDRRAAIYDSHPGWLPAVEVLGEGVFLQLNATKLTEWEALPEVRTRALRIDSNYQRRIMSGSSANQRQITARLLLIHSLAHALINQWSLDCGYPAASLRERLYVSDSMAGLLIYTATSDSAGSLGGVIAQAQWGRLDTALTEAIGRVSWCSADPLCIEADTQGVDSLNLAACHSCILLPEVSCENMNVFLDRGMLVGIPTGPSSGFFAALASNS